MSRPALYGDARHWGLIHADALELLGQLPERSVDAVVTDPPYGIGFNGEAWDGSDIRRVVQSDGERLGAGQAFQRWTTTWGAEVRRVLKPGGHLVTFGAPRTVHRLTVGLEDAGLEIRDQLLWLYGQGMPKSRRYPGDRGTTLKPAYEPIVLGRAPLVGNTAATLSTYGTGLLQIGATRIGADGRWPANILLSHEVGCTEEDCESTCTVGLLDAASDARPSRFFYAAKAGTAEREAGCQHLQLGTGLQWGPSSGKPSRLRHNAHPTVKPLDLMRWLVRLVAPPGGLVLDPFTGSGTTGAAAVLEGRRFIGIERESGYTDIARARISHWSRIAREQAA